MGGNQRRPRSSQSPFYLVANPHAAVRQPGSNTAASEYLFPTADPTPRGLRIRRCGRDRADPLVQLLRWRSVWVTSPSAPACAALIDRLRPVVRRCVELECRSPAGGVRQPQSFPRGVRVTEGTPRERHEVWHPRDVAVRSSSRAWLDDPFSSPLLFVDCRFLTCSESLRISASNARMHWWLVPCGPSALISPHEGHIATVCDLETSRLSTDVDHSSNLLAAKIARHSRKGCQRRWTLRVSIGTTRTANRSRSDAPFRTSTLRRRLTVPIRFPGWSETAIATVCLL